MLAARPAAAEEARNSLIEGITKLDADDDEEEEEEEEEDEDEEDEEEESEADDKLELLRALLLGESGRAAFVAEGTGGF
jgi:hypothetical protein